MVPGIKLPPPTPSTLVVAGPPGTVSSVAVAEVRVYNPADDAPTSRKYSPALVVLNAKVSLVAVEAESDVRSTAPLSLRSESSGAEKPEVPSRVTVNL